MKATLLYGKDGLTINVPEDALIVEPKNIQGLKKEEDAVISAFFR